jgi:hypothetical protein
LKSNAGDATRGLQFIVLTGFGRECRFEREVAAGIRSPLSIMNDVTSTVIAETRLVTPLNDIPMVAGKIVKPIRRRDGTRKMVTAEFT